MINRLAVASCRSLRDITLDLGPLTLITGGNGSGKSSLYGSLRLISEAAQGRLIAALASQGGLSSAIWAGPEKFSRDTLSDKERATGTVRCGPAPFSLRLGFSGEDFGHAIDLGRAEPMHPFQHDPEIKVEAMWTGELLGRANLFAGAVRLTATSLCLTQFARYRPPQAASNCHSASAAERRNLKV